MQSSTATTNQKANFYYNRKIKLSSYLLFVICYWLVVSCELLFVVILVWFVGILVLVFQALPGNTYPEALPPITNNQ